MKYLLRLFFVLNICGVIALAQTPPPPPPPLIYEAPEKSELKEFVSEDKSFQITFPGVPKITKQETGSGTITNYRVYRQGSNSIVNTIEFGGDVEINEEKIYELVRSSVAKTPKSTIQVEKDFQIDGKTGKEFEILRDYHFEKVRILIAGKRIYEIKSDVTNWHILSKYNNDKAIEFAEETRRFFDSFKLNKVAEIASTPAPSDFLGAVKDTSYKNTFFNFALDFPKDWYRLDDMEIQTGKNRGVELLKTDREKTNKAFEEAVKKEVVIFAISQRKAGAEGNPNLAIGVLKQPSNQISAKTVVSVTRDFFLTNPKFKLIKDVENIKINGVVFSTITLETNINNKTVNQKIFMTMRKGYSIDFVLTYPNAEGLKSLEKSLQV